MRNLSRILVILLLIPNCIFLSACVKQSPTSQVTNDQKPVASLDPRINLNTATANELETLPGVGKALAERIIEHRQKYGPFRRAEHLIIVRGISDRKFRAIRRLISVE